MTVIDRALHTYKKSGLGFPPDPGLLSFSRTSNLNLSEFLLSEDK
jgi:hypothetical protein